MVIIIWIAIYPSITLLSVLFGEYLAQIPFVPLRTLIMTLILVPLMVYVLLPFLQKVFRKWIFK
ncbi:MAG: hypothetical protein SFU27_02695 [Thermonemataceae bacterium]|nr:hypothetical protein [Thermonemataceae bacterium]